MNAAVGLTCHEHSGTCVRLDTLEGDVTTLKSKWENMQSLLIGTLISTILSLLGVVFLLLKSGHAS